MTNFLVTVIGAHALSAKRGYLTYSLTDEDTGKDIARYEILATVSDWTITHHPVKRGEVTMPPHTGKSDNVLSSCNAARSVMHAHMKSAYGCDFGG